jgi:hypothetical protein
MESVMRTFPCEISCYHPLYERLGSFQKLGVESFVLGYHISRINKDRCSGCGNPFWRMDAIAESFLPVKFRFYKHIVPPSPSYFVVRNHYFSAVGYLPIFQPHHSNPPQPV